MGMQMGSSMLVFDLFCYVADMQYYTDSETHLQLFFYFLILVGFCMHKQIPSCNTRHTHIYTYFAVKHWSFLLCHLRTF